MAPLVVPLTKCEAIGPFVEHLKLLLDDSVVPSNCSRPAKSMKVLWTWAQSTVS
jgi:hypothetical protein